MSWLARSIANTLKFDDEDEDKNHNESNKDVHKQTEAENLLDSPSSPSSPGRGVKEDFSELTKTLTRQFWGVASFLAPPPPSDQSQVSDSNPNESSRGGGAQASDSEAISGIRSDFAEIGGKFRSEISKLSSNIAVSDITKLASNFLQLGPEEDNYDSVTGAVGVTDEVVAFVRDIAMHPETWLDFPLPEDEYDEDFDMSDAQQEHALAVEHLAPRLAALRIELCPGYMSEDCFWKIYFVLLHPRLDRNDAEVLSTPQIVKARASLTHELQNRIKAKPEEFSSKGVTYSQDITNSPHKESLSVPSTAQSATPTVEPDFETEKHAVQSTKIEIIDKSVINEEPVSKNKDQNLHSSSSSKDIEINDEDDGDDWLKEESSEMAGAGGPPTAIDNDEDVSFSDLEEDDGDVPTNKKVTYCSDSSTKDLPDWVELSGNSEPVSVHNPETKESNDWLNVDDIDVA